MAEQLNLPFPRAGFRHLFDWIGSFLRPPGAQCGSQVRSLNKEDPSLGDKEQVLYQLSADQGRIFRKVIEFTLSLVTILLGTQFIAAGWPPEDKGAMFLPMQLIAGHTAWGLLFVSLGVSRLIVLVVNGWWPPTHLVRKWLSVTFMFCIWLPLVACYMVFLFRTSSEWSLEPSVAGCFALVVLLLEYLIFYAHTSFVWVGRKCAGA